MSLNFNDYLKLLCVTEYVLRFVNNLENKANEQYLIRNKYLRSSEINKAKQLQIFGNQAAICNDNKDSDEKFKFESLYQV